MPKLSVVSGDHCIAALIPVPKHRELGRGFLRKIIHTADIGVEEFIKLLK